MQMISLFLVTGSSLVDRITINSNFQVPEDPPVVIEDVTHMSNLVHQLYKEACESQAAYAEEHYAQQRAAALAAAPGSLEQREVQANTGARYDSDNENDDTDAIVNEV